MADRKQRFVVLDGLRGVAACVVALFHFIGLSGAPHVDLVNGNLAVDFFFCLSGFVLAHANGAQLRDRTLGGWRFFKMRVARLWPMILIGSVVGIVLLPFSHVKTTPIGSQVVPTIALSFVALPFWAAGKPLWINGVYWSLSAEMVANVVYGIIGRFLSHLVLVAVFCLFAFGFAVFVFHSRHPHPYYDVAGWVPGTLIRALSSFFAGVIVYRFWSSRAKNIVLPSTLVVFVLLILLIAPIEKLDLNWLISLIVINTVFPLVVLLGASARLQMPRLMAAAGDASFPLYAIHLPVAVAAGSLLHAFSDPEKWIISIILIAMLFAVSVWIARQPERALIGKLRHRLLGQSRRLMVSNANL